MVEKEEHRLGGMFGNVGLLDISSMHPSSIVAMNLFGPYTERFDAIRQARIAIKHKDFDRCLDIFRKFVPEERLKDLEPVLKGEDSKALAQALKIAINAVYGLTSASFPTRFNDAANPNNRNLDNKVAKRGALFMIALKHKVQELGYTVVHIKTDSIKIADVDRDIIDFVTAMGKQYGYNFELESIYDKMCIVNKSTYIAHSVYGEHCGEWTATGLQFQVPYVFKTLFTKEPVALKDFRETKSAQSNIFLDFNEGLGPDEHHYSFVGKVSAFSPVKSGCGGGLLVRENNRGGYDAVSGTKGYRWKEYSVIRDNGLSSEIDRRYYERLADDAIDTIEQYGSYEWLIDESSPYSSPNPASNDLMKELAA